MKRLTKISKKINKTAKMKKAAATNVAFVRNLRTNVDYEINLKVDDIEEKMEKITEGWKYDYEIVDIISDINYYKEYMNYEDLITMQEILNDSNADINAINAYLNTYSNNVGEAYAASRDVIIINADNEEDFGYEIIDLYGGMESLDDRTKEMYFDYESFGRDEIINTGATYYDGAYYIWD